MSPTLVRVIHITWMVIAVAIGTYAGLMGMNRKWGKGPLRRLFPVRYNRRMHINAGLSFLTMLFLGAPLGLYSSYLQHGRMFGQPMILAASAALLILFFYAGYYGILLWRHGYDKRRARVHATLNALGFALIALDLFFALRVLLR